MFCTCMRAALAGSCVPASSSHSRAAWLAASWRSSMCNPARWEKRRVTSWSLHFTCVAARHTWWPRDLPVAGNQKPHKHTSARRTTQQHSNGPRSHDAAALCCRLRCDSDSALTRQRRHLAIDLALSGATEPAKRQQQAAAVRVGDSLQLQDESTWDSRNCGGTG